MRRDEERDSVGDGVVSSCSTVVASPPPPPPPIFRGSDRVVGSKERNNNPFRRVRTACCGLLVVIAAALLFLFAAHDAGVLRAQTLTNEQICASDTVGIPATWTNYRSDCVVLLNIKDTLQGEVPEGGTAPLNWGADTRHDQWTGVTRQGAGAPARVSILNLSDTTLGDNNLTGSIPAELGNLTRPIELDLSGNELTGSIPAELGDLSMLQRLYLNGNQLTGSIPAELGDLSSLTVLYLQNNRLTGSIPPELGDLSSLIQLLLNGNQLTGSIPAELGDLSSLNWLWLRDNQLSGSIPAELGSLGALTSLHLQRNQLTGSIPAELGNLSNLQWLYLQNNRLSGTIPSELGSLTNLLELYLSGNQLTGSIPSQLNSLVRLQRLVLEDNQLTGGIPVLNALIELTHLGLGGNDLDLDWTMFEGSSAPFRLDDLTVRNQGAGSLKYLSLHDSKLTGGIPTWIDTLHTNLWLLYLHDNQLSGDLPVLTRLINLTHIGLGGNDLDLDWSMFETGSSDLKINLQSVIPSDANYPLEVLLLHDSDLTGPIPDWLGSRHTNLTHLWLHDNALTGSIPANFNGLTNLKELRLDGNMLTGTIPANFGDLTNLEELRLDRNMLTGTVPASFSNLRNLEEVRLEGNMLTGVSEALIGLPKLPIPATVFANRGRSVPRDGESYLLKLALPQGADSTLSTVILVPATVRFEEVYLPPHPRIARIVEVVSAVDIVVVLRDGDGEPVDGAFTYAAVVCVPVPASVTVGDNQELVVLHEFEDGMWRVLESAAAPSGYDPGAGNTAVCGMTDSFSRFVAAVADVVSGGAGAIERISRIEASISSVTLSAGDVVGLSFDIYGRQKILDNALGEGHAFVWDDGGAGGSFRSTKRPNEIIYTAPASPGTHVVTVTPPSGACLTGEDADETADRCTAKFVITVRRSSAVLEERPAPENPIGEIPSVLVDAEGRQYEVFTPKGGGSFNGEAVTISAEPGAVSDLEIVGVRVDVADEASNVGMSHHRYSLAGMWHEVRAVDADGSPVSSYLLQSPAEICLPLPPILRWNISDVALVSADGVGSLTVHSSRVRITPSGTMVCGGVSELPATLAVGRLGSPADLPTPTPEIEPEEPDTGGSAPSGGLLMLLVLVGMGVPMVLRARARWICMD